MCRPFGLSMCSARKLNFPSQSYAVVTPLSHLPKSASSSAVALGLHPHVSKMQFPNEFPTSRTRHVGGPLVVSGRLVCCLLARLIRKIQFPNPSQLVAVLASHPRNAASLSSRAGAWRTRKLEFPTVKLSHFRCVRGVLAAPRRVEH